jgi:hypothetical protein
MPPSQIWVADTATLPNKNRRAVVARLCVNSI